MELKITSLDGKKSGSVTVSDTIFGLDPRTDLIFGNAVMQWLPDHPAIMRRLLEAMPQGGVLAIQMPDNTREPALKFQREVGEEGPWRDHPEIKAALQRSARTRRTSPGRR